MKKNTIILIVAAAAVAGATAWLFGTEKGRKTLGGIKENLDEAGTKIKSGFDSAKGTTAGIIEKGKQYIHSRSNGVKETVS